MKRKFNNEKSFEIPFLLIFKSFQSKVNRQVTLLGKQNKTKSQPNSSSKLHLFNTLKMK